MNLIKNILSHIAHLSDSLWQRSPGLSTRWAHRAFICPLLFLCVAVLNVEAGGTDGKGRGFIPLSDEHIQHIENNWPRIVRVKPNKIGAARICEHLKNTGQTEIDIPVALNHHDEIVHAIGKAAAEHIEGTVLGAGDLPLPPSVDNTTHPSFPPIGDQGNEGSCVAWGSTYYQATHEIGLLNGINNKTSNANILSPKWTYNLLNGGQDEGLMILDAYTLLSQNGAASIATLPYDGNYLGWDLSPQDWIWALSNRTGPAHLVSGLGGSGPQDLTTIKQLLNNGHILTIGTFIDSWVLTTVGNDPANPNSPCAGQQAASWMNGSNGGHCITIVGYNDDIWIDINQNGVVDAGEKGAFLLANSWNTDWGNNGLIWVAYDAFLGTSAVSGGPSAGRVPLADGLNSNAVSVLPIAANYSPSLIAQFSLTQSVRNQISVSGGVSDTSHSQPTTTFASGALAFGGGAYEFDGSSPGAPEPGTFAIDLTDLLASVADPNAAARFYLSLTDNQQQNPTILTSFSLIDNVHNQTVSFSGAPITFDNQSVNPYIEYTFNGDNAPNNNPPNNNPPNNTPPNNDPPFVPYLPYFPYQTQLHAAITSPADGDAVQDTVNVDVSVSDNINVNYVEFYVDSQYIGWTGDAPYVFAYDTTQLSNGTHEFAVIAYDHLSNTSEASVNVQVNNTTSFSAIYVNAGGGQVAYQGVTWQDDRAIVAHSRVASRDLKFSNPVYNSERYGDFSYSFSVPNGNYNVKLKFAELFFNRKNKRVFNVAINGNQVVTDLDLVKVAGFATPYDLTFPVNVSDGSIKIDFTSSVNLGKVNAIEITQS